MNERVGVELLLVIGFVRDEVRYSVGDILVSKDITKAVRGGGA